MLEGCGESDSGEEGDEDGVGSSTPPFDGNHVEMFLLDVMSSLRLE